MDTDIQNLIDEANRYQQFAHNTLDVHNPDPKWWLGVVVVRFCFPQVTDEDCELISTLAVANRLAGNALNKRVEVVVGNPDRLVPAVMDFTEDLFMKIKSEVLESGILDRVTPIQRRLLEQVFMVVEIDDPK